MLRPRRFDEEGLKAYLDDVRPRFLVLRVHADKANIVWGVPLWAAEEIVAFAVGAAAILKGALPLLPGPWREKLLPGIRFAGYAFGNYAANASASQGYTATGGHGGRSANGDGNSDQRHTATDDPRVQNGSDSRRSRAAEAASGGSSRGAAWAEIFSTINSLAGGSLRDVLRIPPGEPYVQVATHNTRIEIVAY